MSAASVAGASWLAKPALQALLAALNAGGEEARIAGGAIRNQLLGQPVTDVDIAATSLPAETTRRAEAAGFRVIATGIDHGTVTVLAGAQAYEVTTLRADVETDGRRARVAFGRDWQEDAERRDFTINALYATAAGEVIDPVGGLEDIARRRLRFIGDAGTRIREDYLRILRFFRFFAWYGSGRPDSEGLKACARLKGGLGGLSAERVWSELKKLLSAPDPSRALLWMRQASVLTAVLPETEKWGIDAVHALVAAERDLGWPVDPLLRLEAMIPPDAVRAKALAERLKLSNAERDRLAGWAQHGIVGSDIPDRAFRRRLYDAPVGAISDGLKLALAVERSKAVAQDAALYKAGHYARLLRQAENWVRPDYPIRGSDLVELGFQPGKQLGEALERLRLEWLAEDFKPDRESLLERARNLKGPPRDEP